MLKLNDWETNRVASDVLMLSKGSADDQFVKGVIHCAVLFPNYFSAKLRPADLKNHTERILRAHVLDKVLLWNR